MDFHTNLLGIYVPSFEISYRMFFIYLCYPSLRLLMDFYDNSPYTFSYFWLILLLPFSYYCHCKLSKFYLLIKLLNLGKLELVGGYKKIPESRWMGGFSVFTWWDLHSERTSEYNFSLHHRAEYSTKS